MKMQTASHLPSFGLVFLLMSAAAGVRSVAPADGQERKLMSAVTASAFGLPTEVLHMTAVTRPSPKAGTQLLIKTEACSLSPADWRVMSGDNALIRSPAFPYIPGGDVCGTVVEPLPPFAAGDRIVATWGDVFGSGGFGQYTLVDPKLAVLKPQSLTCVQAAALVNSTPRSPSWRHPYTYHPRSLPALPRGAISCSRANHSAGAGHALAALRAVKVKPGDRVLVLGGGGGVSTSRFKL